LPIISIVSKVGVEIICPVTATRSSPKS